MAAKGSVYANDILALIFNGTAITNLAQNGVSPLTTLYMSLHTANPHTTAGSGTVDTQNASEAAYGSYARQPVNRDGTGFNVSAAAVNLVTLLQFPQASSGSETETYFGVGVAVSGATKLLYWGTITPNIVVATGITPELTTAANLVTET